MRRLKSRGNRELVERIVSRIRESGGSLAFSEFMQACLYEDGLGYYASAERVIGRKGDFYTSVSVGALFGELMARQFCEVDAILGREAFVICEQGGHDGTFAVDVLSWIKKNHGDLLGRLKYRLIEPLAARIASQRLSLERAGVAEYVEWYPTPEAMSQMAGVFFSNELVDAFPVDLIVWRESAWKERRVGLEGDEFCWREEVVKGNLAEFVNKLPRAEEGYCMEVNLAAGVWLTSVARKIERGVVLTVDYGYRRPADKPLPEERADGTLACYQGHIRSDNPFEEIGLQDITAHVDFENLIQVGERVGLQFEGFTDQHHALVGLAQGDFLKEGEVPSPEKLRAFKQLMHPELMGTSFKVLVQSKNIPVPKLSCLTFGRR